MFINYIKFAFRNFNKNKEYTFINIFGLAVGLAAFILIFLFLQFQWSFDKFNQNYDRIYRVDQHIHMKGEVQTANGTQFPLAPALKRDYPEILKATRIQYCGDYLSSDEEHTFREGNGMWADNEIFEIFDFQFIEGNPQNALTMPMTIVLTEELANKYFPGENALGKMIRFQTDHYLQITGIIRKMPENSTLRPDFMISFSSLKPINNFDIEGNWGWWMCITYVLLDKNVDVELFGEKIVDALDKYSDLNPYKKLILWPLSKINLQYNDQNDSRPFYYLLALLAIITLLIACVNFMNLATAYSSTRTREIGIKKLVGSQQSSLIVQFLSEAIIIALIALFLAFILAEIFLPQINLLIRENLKIQYFRNIKFVLFMLIITFFTGLISGSYPAFYLSATPPLSVLRGIVGLRSKNPILRKILVVFQFTLSVALIIGTIIMYRQLDFMRKKELGFDKENLIVGNIQMKGENAESQYEALRNDLLSDARIINMTWSHNAPFYGGETWECQWEGGPPDEKIHILHNHVDFNFIDTYGIKLKAGRYLSKEFPSDREEACLINETAAKRLGWEYSEAIGKTITNEDDDYRIIGIIEDFHLYSVLAPISPYFVSYTTRELSWGNIHTIKLSPHQDIVEMKDYVTKKFREYFPGHNIEFNIYDENFNQRNYAGIDILGKFFGIFAILAICIAVTGLFGLVSFISKQRTHEIGIRKAIGAPIASIVNMLLTEFIKLLLIAIIIAIPIAWFSMNTLLQNFAYRIGIAWWIFVLAGMIALLIAFLTVIWQAVKAATANPVESLRYE